jgi:hypothetical protein
MTLAAVNPGGWVLNEILTSAQMTALQALILKAIDGVDGGAYALQDDLEFDGPGKVILRHLLDVEAGATVTLKANAVMLVQQNADVTIENGGDLHVADGGDVNVNDGGDVNLASGAAINAAAGSLVKMATPAELTLDNASVNFRLTLGGAHVAPLTWTPLLNGMWIDSDASGKYVLFPLTLPVGDSITTLRLTLHGNIVGGAGHSGASPADMPQLQLIKVHPITGALSVISTVVDPYTGAAFDSSHSIVMNSATLPFVWPYVMTSEAHFVRVLGEGPTGGIANCTGIISIDGTAIARSFRNANETY